MPRIDYRNSKGEKVSGVTTILGSNLGWSKQPLMYWAWKEGTEGRDFKKTAELAATAGTICHAFMDADIKGLPSPTFPEVNKEIIEKAETGFINYLQWKDTHKLKMVASETSIVVEKGGLEFGATLDCIAEVNGHLSLFDWKTSNAIYEDYLSQVAAYKYAWEFKYPDKPLTGGIHLLKINKETAAFTHHWWQVLPEAWEAFECCLKLHNLRKVLKKQL